MVYLTQGRARADPMLLECTDRLVDRLRDVVNDFKSCLVIGGGGAPSMVGNRVVMQLAQSIGSNSLKAHVQGMCFWSSS